VIPEPASGQGKRAGRERRGKGEGREEIGEGEEGEGEWGSPLLVST